MRNLLKLFGIIALVVVMGFTLIGCGDGGGGGPAGDPALTGTVSISGTAKVGETLTADTSSLGGSGNISYQWKRNPASGAAINVGTGGTYVVAIADVGSTITVTVTRAGYSGSKTSNPTATVPNPEPELTGSVSISGTAEVGETLTAVISSLGGTGELSYQWKRNPATGAAVNIGTNNTYEVAVADIGATITVTVTRAGYSGSKTSDPTAVVTDPSLPPLSGTVSISGFAEVGQTLTAVTTALLGEGAISYQWKRNPTGGTAIVIGTGSTYLVVDADVGSTITVTVTRTGNSSSVISDPTATVPNPNENGTLTISVSAGGDPVISDPNSLIVDGVLTLRRNAAKVTLALANSSLFDAGSIRWRVQNTAKTGSEGSFDIYPDDPAYLTGKIYFITVEASINAIPFDFTISFTITEE